MRAGCRRQASCAGKMAVARTLSPTRRLGVGPPRATHGMHRHGFRERHGSRRPKSPCGIATVIFQSPSASAHDDAIVIRHASPRSRPQPSVESDESRQLTHWRLLASSRVPPLHTRVFTTWWVPPSGQQPAEMARWPVPSLAVVRGTSLGAAQLTYEGLRFAIRDRQPDFTGQFPALSGVLYARRIGTTP
jgi:hypothetical protein